jgi:hypothetical protein
MAMIGSADESAKAIRDATCDGLKRIYLIILGLAIAQALTRTFSDQNGFVGNRLVEREHLTEILLLVAFLPTAIRFAHGGVLHLSAFTGVDKWRRDMLGLLLQAILFFIMSLTTTDVFLFLMFFSATLVLDTLWLIAISKASHPFSMEHQWLVSNGVLFVLAVVLLWSLGRGLPAIAAAGCVAFFSLAATLYDYSRNRDEYFPPVEKASKSLGVES